MTIEDAIACVRRYHGCGHAAPELERLMAAVRKGAEGER